MFSSIVGAKTELARPRCTGLVVWVGTSARLLLIDQGLEVFLKSQRELESVVHITGLLEATSPFEAIRFVRVRRTGDPTDSMVRVVRNTGGTLCGWKQLKTVVVDEDGGSSTLASVSLHSLLNGLDGRGQYGLQTLLVHGHLNGDVGKSAVDGGVRTGANGGVVL